MVLCSVSISLRTPQGGLFYCLLLFGASWLPCVMSSMTSSGTFAVMAWRAFVFWESLLKELHCTCVLLNPQIPPECQQDLMLYCGVHFWFFEMVSLCNSPSYPGTHSVDQYGFKLTDPPASAWVLGLQVWATTTWHIGLVYVPFVCLIIWSNCWLDSVTIIAVTLSFTVWVNG